MARTVKAARPYAGVGMPKTEAKMVLLTTSQPAFSSQKIGAASQSVEIPNLKDKSLSVSGLVLTEAKADSSPILPPNKAKEAALAPVLSLSDLAVRSFRPEMIMSYNFSVNNPPTGNVTTQVKVFNDGKLFFEGPEIPLDTSQPKSSSFIDGGLIRIKPEMPVGNYVLQIVVKDTNKKDQTASQWIDFEITR